MKIELRRIMRPVFLRDYAEEYGDEVKIYTWVNPPRAKRLEMDSLGAAALQARDRLNDLLERGKAEDLDEETQQQITQELEALTEELNALSAEVQAWYADLWSQHPDPETHWTFEDVQELVAACQENDPALWDWLQQQSTQAIEDHRQGLKKKS